MKAADDIEISAMGRAYDELKRLDPEGRQRAVEWLRAKFESEEVEGKKAREASARERIARRAHPTTGDPSA
jgi:hypothetical protein